MKIEMASQRGRSTVRLSGQFQAEHIAELKKQLQDNGPRFVLDLTEVTVVDVEVVRFFGACEANGVKIVHCPRYIREWINRERKRASARRTCQKKADYTMSIHTALTVPTRFVEVDNNRFAYRRWGKPGGFPLVFMNYFTGNLDDWDPLVTDGFAADYDIILFDNAGVGSSGGETPGTVLEMTRHAVAFCDAVGLKRVNAVGFSLGGMIAQQLALDYPDRVNRIILLGTGPRGGEGMTFTELSSEERADLEQFLLAAFFSPTDASQAAGRAYLKRLAARTTDRDRPVSPRTAEAQLHAIREWGAVPSSNRYATLKNIKHPTLVVHGTKDIVVLPINAFILAEHLPDAQLIMYPDSNHGAQYQHAEVFLKHAKLFLSA